MRERMQPCIQCGREVRVGVPFCDIVCAYNYAHGLDNA